MYCTGFFLTHSPHVLVELGKHTAQHNKVHSLPSNSSSSSPLCLPLSLFRSFLVEHTDCILSFHLPPPLSLLLLFPQYLLMNISAPFLVDFFWDAMAQVVCCKYSCMSCLSVTFPPPLPHPTHPALSCRTLMLCSRTKQKLRLSGRSLAGECVHLSPLHLFQLFPLPLFSSLPSSAAYSCLALFTLHFPPL